MDLLPVEAAEAIKALEERILYAKERRDRPLSYRKPAHWSRIIHRCEGAIAKLQALIEND